MPTLKEGAEAPDFSLPSTEGKEISLAQFQGKKNVVLYFYPKDNTPGCTKEACDFRDSAKRLTVKDAVVLGVSADSLKSHDSFREKFKLSFPLLSDEGKKMLQKYGVWKEKSFMGNKFMGIERTTVIIDKAGKVRKVFAPVKVDGHTEEVLKVLETL